MRLGLAGTAQVVGVLLFIGTPLAAEICSSRAVMLPASTVTCENGHISSIRMDSSQNNRIEIVCCRQANRARTCNKPWCGSIDPQLEEICKEQGWAGHSVLAKDEDGVCICTC